MADCYYCGIRVYSKEERRNTHNYPLMTLDHIVPRSLTHGQENIATVIACAECNTAKGSLTREEYRVLLAFRYGYVTNVQFQFMGELNQ